MKNKTLGDELHEENAQAEYLRLNGHTCIVCGTKHIGVIDGYCNDHQRQRADSLAAQLATAQAELAQVTELLEDFKLLHGVARRERDALQAQLDEIGEEDFK